MRQLAQWFESIETGKPFVSCKICQNSLSTASKSWVVNKHYHRKECVLEYAICDQCRDDVAGSFSEASKKIFEDLSKEGLE
ncbi:MAG: hypothetical protein V4727_09640, partial [Verrucomicrobiota bacterium]